MLLLRTSISSRCLPGHLVSKAMTSGCFCLTVVVRADKMMEMEAEARQKSRCQLMFDSSCDRVKLWPRSKLPEESTPRQARMAKNCSRVVPPAAMQGHSRTRR